MSAHTDPTSPEAAEADVLDQSAPATEPDVDDAGTDPVTEEPLPGLVDPADALEQKATISADDDDLYPRTTDDDGTHTG